MSFFYLHQEEEKPGLKSALCSSCKQYRRESEGMTQVCTERKVREAELSQWSCVITADWKSCHSEVESGLTRSRVYLNTQRCF